MSGTDAAAAAGSFSSLPQDLLAEILARVPSDVAFLFRCALVCKRWRRLLADPAFLRRLFPEAGRSSSLLGFFVQRRRPSGAVAWRRITSLFKNRAPAFVPAPGSAVRPRRRFLTSFVRDAAGLLNKAEPLAERGGLVLLRVFPRGAARGNKMFSLCVCSLLTGKLDVLPTLDAACFDGEGVSGYAVLPSTNQSAAAQQPAAGYSNLCKVLLIGVHCGSKQLNIHSFSTAATALQNWGTQSVNCLTGDEGSFSGPYGSRVATVCCDTAHWLFQEDGTTEPTMFTVDVSIDTGHVCSSRFVLDVPWSSTQLSLSIDARLSFLYHKHNHLVIRTLRDLAQGGKCLATMCVAEKSDTALVLFCSDRGSAYSLDLQSRLPTELVGWKRSFNYKTAVPYEINWSELFMARLGVQL